jgi:hypothetical protein
MAKKRYTRRKVKTHKRQTANRRLRLSMPLKGPEQRPIRLVRRERVLPTRTKNSLVVTTPKQIITAPKARVLTKKPKQDTINQMRVCKRRYERKQIIHAIGKSGTKGQKLPDNKTRRIKC